jgi:chemotaxis protein CheD
MVTSENLAKDGSIPEAIRLARRSGKARTVGIGQMCVSEDPADVLVTYSLGSCVGLTLHDPVHDVGGLIHCMLPLSQMSPDKAQERPCMFVDTGVTRLLQAIFDLGASRRDIVARVAGGAHMLDRNQTFRIGRRNFAVLRKILWKNEILIDAQDLGGTVSRTLFFHVGTGVTAVKTGRSVKLL